ncbi:hypothetical protein I8748_24405 [Nostoc sp. CENA67]|uniref:Cell division protein FtsL n=1 Tax=Amazonocrinis nigriterrae CENA67 TaxID=2794033 RepID=A0A8J7HSU9_9NOST|nr:hypothetical protein [Amazonocrinis nigriterrae]MBH8565286.1 hypothetical protein [Amazonocrinis nigriterrae CENA67]
MAAARKSAVSVTSTRFRRDSTTPSKKRLFGRLGSAVQNDNTLAAQTPAIRSQNQRRSAKDSSVAVTSGVSQLDSQQVSNLPGKSSAMPKISKTSSVSLPTMPSSTASPLWLLWLYKSHRYTSVVAFLLVVATLVVYGWTVYSRQLWSQDLRRLDSLRLSERQLTTTNATLTNKMAEEAQKPTAGLVSPTPARTIFLRLPSGTTQSTTPSPTPNPQMQQPTSSPRGY